MALGPGAPCTAPGGADRQTTSQNHQAEATNSRGGVDDSTMSRTTTDNATQPTLRTLAEGDRPLYRSSSPRSLSLLVPAPALANVQPEADNCQIVTKKGKERGRTSDRGPRCPNPLARAESKTRDRRSDAAIELDATSIAIGKRISRSSTFFEDPSDPCAILDDKLLEPCPYAHVCASMSEVLIDSIAMGKVRPIRMKGPFKSSSQAVTTMFRDCLPLYPAPTLPTEALSHALPNSNHLEYIAIKSSSLHWPNWESPAKRRRTASKLPASVASQLPTEIIQQIYYSLALTDFNSARHTCRLWFINSLERSLLEAMLKRGGFSSSTQRDVPANCMLPSTKVMVNDEWLMSKRISRECALGPDWTGNGLKGHLGSRLESSKSAFVHTATIDFNDFAIHHHNSKSSGTLFTASSCGRFLMAANGCLVYIYELNQSHHSSEINVATQPGSLRPVTSIICPSRVLACSMDTSSHRYAVAILLDGRMGLVCDITALNPNLSRNGMDTSVPQKGLNYPPSLGNSIQDVNHSKSSSFLDHVSRNSPGSTLATSRASTEPPFISPGIATTGANMAFRDDSAWQGVFRGDTTQLTQTEKPSSRHGSVPRANVVGQGSRLHRMPASPPENANVNGSMPIENGPRSLYRNLCSDDDPPRSVAICPQRRCVAFGCSSGIELHWVDALTGQDLNRWFPLTAPSDFLFFLPPRKSVDSAKKLRLISSAARPSERPAIAARAFGGPSRSSPFWERPSWGASQIEDGNDSSGISKGLTRGRVAGLDAGARGNNRRTDCSDHYRAVPLSDGYHILFTDPATGILCLGSDAPVGGPTKLLRKIWFQGPEREGSPIIYAGGSDLRWGVRVVAAFGAGEEQSVWLFSVPPDIFTANQSSHPASNGSIWIKSRAIRESQNTGWVDWWPENGLQEWLSYTRDSMPGLSHQSVWPVRIRGQELGKCAGVVDLAVDAGSSMIIWAFSREGIAKVWEINNGRIGDVKKRWVMRDGTIREDDCEGDTEMSDAGSSSLETLALPLPLQPESFDGTTSLNSPTVSIPRAARHQKGHGRRTRYDADGDVMMDYPGGSGLSDEEACSYEDFAWTFCERGTVNQTTHWTTRRGQNNWETDFMARVDIEIH